MSNFQDLPDELILKVLSYSKIKALITCGQASKRIRKISRDNSLWRRVTLKKKIVKTELLELILGKGCTILRISNSTILGSLNSKLKSQIRVLDLSQLDPWDRDWTFPNPTDWTFPNPTQINCTGNIEALENLLLSCSTLQHLSMTGLFVSPKMVDSICKNGKTLQVLNLNNSFVFESSYAYTEEDSRDRFDYTVPLSKFQEIIKFCQELKEVNLNYINEEDGLTNNEGLQNDDLEFFAEHLSPNVEKINLQSTLKGGLADGEVEILLKRCNKIKKLNLDAKILIVVD